MEMGVPNKSQIMCKCNIITNLIIDNYSTVQVTEWITELLFEEINFGHVN